MLATPHPVERLPDTGVTAAAASGALPGAPASRRLPVASAWRPRLIAAVAAALLVASACSPSVPPSSVGTDGPTLEVEVAVAAEQEIARTSTATGTVEPWRRVSPGTKILGRIVEVAVREGDRVDAAQVLARLERRDLEAAVEQARAAVAIAEARLENARVHHRRMVELHEQDAVTDKALEDATAAFRVAEAGRRVALADQAAAEVTLSYADVTAPLEGWLLERRVEAGDMATPGTPLFVIEDLSRVKITARVPESEVVDLRAGDPARVTIEVLDRTVEARIDRILPAANQPSRTFDVQLVVDNADGAIKSGMFARASFRRGTALALLVPESAVVRRGQLEGVFVVDAERVARIRWLKLGRLDDGHRIVLAGLRAGDRYVVAPPPRLTDGTAVGSRRP